VRTQLRKCCNHPYLFPGAEPPGGSDTLEALLDASGKLTLLDRLLAKLHAAGHRVVLFSQFTSMLDLLETYLDGRGYECAARRLRSAVYAASFR
jgi:SWI/SNF-related matrix-associated actin-dependent regulator of chromatin subfamily A member 5